MSFTIHQATRELIGKRFFRLVVVGVGRHPKSNVVSMVCICDCGNAVHATKYRLEIGRIKSCGCWSRERPRKGNVKHGECRNRVRSLTYESWTSMKTRCLNPKSSGYRIYGGRGIGIDPAWLDFEQFLLDMGKRPSKAYSLERKDNSKGYSAGNCKWATRTEQGRNKRTNHLICCNGTSLMLKDWEAFTGINRTTITSRLKLGWPVELALSVKPNFANDISKL